MGCATDTGSVGQPPATSSSLLVDRVAPARRRAPPPGQACYNPRMRARGSPLVLAAATLAACSADRSFVDPPGSDGGAAVAGVGATGGSSGGASGGLGGLAAAGGGSAVGGS